MDVTNNSYNLMKTFANFNCIDHITQTNISKNIFSGLFKHMNDFDKELTNIKSTISNKHFYNRRHKKIITKSDIASIPIPKTFSVMNFPEELPLSKITSKMSNVITYSINLFNRHIDIIFTTEKHNVILKTYDSYVDNILIWLYIVNKYADQKCVNNLTLYFYKTNHIKQFPTSNIEIIDQIHANTAFTRTCQINGEIVIFRNEEWFKVFLHETIHTFGLDFSGVNNEYCTKNILSLFNIKSDVNLFEAYTEFWARIINVLFCSYNKFKQENIKQNKISVPINYNKLNDQASIFINIEIKYSFFQMVKILNFMDLKYDDIHNNDNKIQIKYKENTNVFAYYIITTILITNYNKFLSWCQKHNTSILQFDKDISGQVEFCKFIYNNYKNRQLLEAIKCTEQILNKDNNINNSLRMTVCEME